MVIGARAVLGDGVAGITHTLLAVRAGGGVDSDVPSGGGGSSGGNGGTNGRGHVAEATRAVGDGGRQSDGGGRGSRADRVGDGGGVGRSLSQNTGGEQRHGHRVALHVDGEGGGLVVYTECEMSGRGWAKERGAGAGSC